MRHSELSEQKEGLKSEEGFVGAVNPKVGKKPGRFA